MLRELYIKNVAIIDELRAEFSDGFNVITGETGAGKSIIIGALGLCLGEKFTAQDIRSGAKDGCVEAVFSLPPKAEALRIVSEQGIPFEGGEIVIRRALTANGRSRAYVNGSPVAVTALRALGDSLLDIHGQHHHQQLLHQEYHLDILDGYGRLFTLRHRLEESYGRLQEVQARLQQLQEAERARYRTQDLLKYQIEEIEAARLRPEEDGELERELILHQNAEKLYEAASQAYSMLYDSEGSVNEQIAMALGRLEDITRLDPHMGGLLEEGKSSMYQLQDLADRLRDYRDKISFDPARLSQIDERLHQIRDLKKKYGGTIPEIMAFRENALSQLSELEGCLEEIEKLEGETEELRTELSALALQLSEKRKEAAQKLEAEAESELKQLNMKGALLHIGLEQIEDPQGFVEQGGAKRRLYPWGIDQAEFLFSANPGEEPKPLSRIASGGEIARVMLALKSILAEVDRMPILIFDEVDAGIGGRVAEVVGRKLKSIARKRQVFCVTHLPQIAAMAAHHHQIEKVSRRGRNVTTMRELSHDDRLEEIARMSGGERITQATLDHARELLEKRP